MENFQIHLKYHIFNELLNYVDSLSKSIFQFIVKPFQKISFEGFEIKLDMVFSRV